MNFNRAIILGNLTRDPESRTLPSGQSVVSFSIATNRIWSDQSGNKQQAVEYHNVVAFGKLAEICSRYLNKGRLVLIEGRLRTTSWQDKTNANIKHYRTEIIADNMQMGPRGDGGAGMPQDSNQQTASPTQDDIPVIETEEPAASSDKSNQGDAPPAAGEEPSQVVDVENIPF